jgi:uncharacterized membrane protein
LGQDLLQRANPRFDVRDIPIVTMMIMIIMVMIIMVMRPARIRNEWGVVVVHPPIPHRA